MVWQKVLDTDYARPGTAVLARASDPRVRQFWDPGSLLARSLVPALRADLSPVVGKESLVKGDLPWDFVSVYPAGVRWGESLPPAAFRGGPVVRVVDELRRHLDNPPSP